MEYATKIKALELKSNTEPCERAFFIPSGIQTKYDNIMPVSPKKREILNLGFITSVTGSRKVYDFPKLPVKIPENSV